MAENLCPLGCGMNAEKFEYVYGYSVNIKEKGLDKLDIEPLSDPGASLATPKTPEPIINYAKAKQ